MKKVCVFGGSGFLGSHVADELTKSGYRVLIFDKAPSKWIQSTQEMIIGDLLDPCQVDKVLADCEIVYNFAALADLNEGTKKPVETIKVNVLGNSYIMDACLKHNIKRFIYASTIYVYSKDGGFYRCSKQSAEHYVEEYKKTFNLDYTILRFGSLYGPRANATNGIYRIVKHAIEKGFIKYQGSSAASREYIHVQDAARASVNILEEQFKNQSFILTGQEKMKVNELLEMLSEIMGIKKEIVFENFEINGHYVRTPYSYLPPVGKKLTLPIHVDIGQGLLQIIEEINQELGNI